MNKDELQFIANLNIADLNRALARGQELDIKYQTQKNENDERAQKAMIRRKQMLFDRVFLQLPPELVLVAHPYLTITSEKATLDLPGCDTVYLRLAVKDYFSDVPENMQAFITDVWVENSSRTSRTYTFRSEFSMHENILMAVFAASQVPEPDELPEPAQEEPEPEQQTSVYNPNQTPRPIEALQDALRAFILETLEENHE